MEHAKIQTKNQQYHHTNEASRDQKILVKLSYQDGKKKKKE